MRRLVIIGNSAAGLAAIEAIRARDRQSPVTLIAAERHPPYSRVMLTYLLAGKVSRDELYLHGPEWYRQMGVKALTGQRAVAIDTRARQVLVEPALVRDDPRVPRVARPPVSLADRPSKGAGGMPPVAPTCRTAKPKRVPYDRLLLATGALAQRPALPGIDLPGVFCLRDLDDAIAILKYAETLGPHARAAFLGGGPVCLQALTALADRGMRVTLVVRSPAILSQLADGYTAGLAENVLRRNGVRVRTSAEPVGIELRSRRQAAGLTVHLRSAQPLAADLVIIGKGTQPDTALARSSAIATDVGILADETMATSAEGVYAAGDVAQATHCVTGRKVCYGTWTNACEQGRIAGLNMIGFRTEWTGGLNRNVTTLFGHTLGSVGILRPGSGSRGGGDGRTLHHHVDPRRHVSRRLIFRNGRCDGAVVWNACDDLGVLSWLISTRHDCSGWEQRLTRGEATLGDALRRGLTGVPRATHWK
jgi:nitrite reductase (NADH) large subunit